jgi:hypothetical protein
MTASSRQMCLKKRPCPVQWTSIILSSRESLIATMSSDADIDGDLIHAAGGAAKFQLVYPCQHRFRFFLTHWRHSPHFYVPHHQVVNQSSAFPFSCGLAGLSIEVLTLNCFHLHFLWTKEYTLELAVLFIAFNTLADFLLSGMTTPRTVVGVVCFLCSIHLLTSCFPCSSHFTSFGILLNAHNITTSCFQRLCQTTTR